MSNSIQNRWAFTTARHDYHIMVDKAQDSTIYVISLAGIIITTVIVIILLINHRIIPDSLIQASDFIAVIVSSILTYAVVVIYASIYKVEKRQRAINEQMRKYQELQTKIIRKQTHIMARQGSFIKQNYKPILSVRFDKIYEGSVYLKLSNKGRGRAVEPHIRMDITIGGEHSTDVMLEKDHEFSGRDQKIHGEDIENTTYERYLIPTFSRVIPAESSQDPRSTAKYLKTAIEPGDDGDYKAPVMMGISKESQPYYERSGQKFESWGKYLDNLASPVPMPDKMIDWQITLLYQDEIGDIYSEDLLSGRIYDDYGIHVTGNEDDSMLFIEGSEEEEEAVILKKNLGDIISTLRDLPVGSGMRREMDIEMDEIKSDYQEYTSGRLNDRS